MGEQITINGIVYYRLYVPDPVAEGRAITSVVGFWQHDECDGDIYIGSNAHLYCNRCGKDMPIVSISWATPMTSLVSANYVCSNLMKGHVPSIIDLYGSLARMASTTGLKWFCELTRSLNTYGLGMPIPSQY